MHKFKFRFLLISLLFLCLLLACSNKEVRKLKSETTKSNTKKIKNKIPQNKKEKDLHNWYYFVKNNRGNLEIKQAKTLNSIPKVDFLPWTEAMRLSSVGLMYEKPILLINSAGIINITEIKKNNEIERLELFTKKTIDGFYKSDIGILIKAYTNTIFSILPEDINKASEKNYCIYRYNSINKKLIPVIDTESLKLPKKAQLTKLVHGESWLASFKTEVNSKVDFNYVEFNNFKELTKAQFVQMSHEKFMSKTEPERLIKSNIDDFKEKILKTKYKKLRLEIFKEDEPSKVTYIKKTVANTEETNYEEEKEVTATACEFTNSSNNKHIKAILFSTGEFYYSENKKNWSKVILPKLPKNFVYTYFVIYNNKIWAGWEEEFFFQVARAGLLEKKLK